MDAIGRVRVAGRALAGALLLVCTGALAAPIVVEVEDFDTEGSAFDLPGAPIGTIAGFVPSASLGGIGPRDGVNANSKIGFLGQTTEQAQALVDAGSPATQLTALTVAFTVPALHNGRLVTSVGLQYDFILLTDDLDDFGLAGVSDLADDDRFQVRIGGAVGPLVLLDMDADEVFDADGLAGLAAPATPSDPAETTGFEKRTGGALPGNPYLTGTEDLTGLRGRAMLLTFELAEPDAADVLESGFIVDELRLTLAVPEPGTGALLMLALAVLGGGRVRLRAADPAGAERSPAASAAGKVSPRRKRPARVLLRVTQESASCRCRRVSVPGRGQGDPHHGGSGRSVMDGLGFGSLPSQAVPGGAGPLRRRRALAAVSFAALLVVPAASHGFAFLGTPQFAAGGGTSNDWGRLLWNEANVRVGAGGDRQMLLNYDFGAAGQSFEFRDNAGAVVATLKSRAWRSPHQAVVRRAVGTWNAAAQAPRPDPLAGSNVIEDIPTGRVDLESTVLHEIGHALGLGHPNIGRRPGTPRSLASYLANHTPQGARHLHAGQDRIFGTADDVTLPGGDGAYGTGDDQIATDVLHNLDFAGPLRGPATPTQTAEVQWTRTVTEPQPGRLVRNLPASGAIEAVMVQGSFRDELHNILAADDFRGLRALQSGADFHEGPNPALAARDDDFEFRLAAPDDGHVEISFWNVDLSRAGAVGQARDLRLIPARGGAVRILLDDLLPTEELLGVTAVWSTSGSLADIIAVDVFLDVPFHTGVPAPATLALLLAGLAAVRRGGPRAWAPSSVDRAASRAVPPVPIIAA